MCYLHFHIVLVAHSRCAVLSGTFKMCQVAHSKCATSRSSTKCAQNEFYPDSSQGIQLSTPSSRGHWPALVSPLPWMEPVGLTNDGRGLGRMAWLWVAGTEASAWCGFAQAYYKDTLLLRPTIKKTLPERLVLRSQIAKNMMTSKAITNFNQSNGNWDHWCVWQAHCPFFEWFYKETCWCVWRPQGAPVAPPASVPGCGQGKCCQHIGLCASLI